MYFFTATINSWQNLLSNNNIKKIITDSLAWLTKENKAYIHGFVVMPNHIPLFEMFRRASRSIDK